MRWEKKKVPECGDKRIKTRFLLFPKEINNEVRWLEKVTYKEIYDYDYNYRFYSWEASEWIDK